MERGAVAGVTGERVLSWNSPTVLVPPPGGCPPMTRAGPVAQQPARLRTARCGDPAAGERAPSYAPPAHRRSAGGWTPSPRGGAPRSTPPVRTAGHEGRVKGRGEGPVRHHPSPPTIIRR
jgi:hypothetical protein